MGDEEGNKIKDVMFMSKENDKIIETIIGKTEIPKQQIKSPYKFNTTQENIVMPTSYLIKRKNTDFRIMLAISGISNCDNIKQEGSNSRYITTQKLDGHTQIQFAIRLASSQILL